ncbi:MAG TPA: glycoside hydrolase family 172 protein [Sedimentisphaerales bacterium]|nr:glycoside hydrolase family 172 protein [Sedimentisphaerales bacterium]
MEPLTRLIRRFSKRMKRCNVWLVCALWLVAFLMAGCEEQQSGFSGLEMGMGNLARLSSAETRSVSPENFTGEKGKGGMATEGTGARAARELGQGWKVSPSVRINPGQTFVMADVEGCGAIQHIWMTPTGNNRFNILRIYWDGEEKPSVECPAGDFFACGMGQYVGVNSLAVCVNPKSGFNCYWVMPFRKSFKITMTNIDAKPMVLYYQIDYTLTDVPKDAAYLHAQFRRVNPLPDKQDYTILEGVRGKGHYVGTYMVWGSNSPGWWGEGEIKFFMDGDSKFPTICGTGTEDYFCGSYGFSKFEGEGYEEFSSPYTGMPQVIESETQPRFGLYRWHIMDPVRFESDLKVTMQALGWQSEGRYLPLKDDLSSVAFWYQAEPHAPFPNLPDKDSLKIE